jgi:hypothetical protein
MNKIESSSSSGSAPLTVVMAILMLMVWLVTAPQASGQSQWTTNGNNINNTNTGNVGIGTTTPGGKLQVAGDTYVGSNDGTIPYTLSMGASGNGYGGVGYGFKFSTTSNTHTYTANDYASMLHFHSGGFRFRTAPLGATGNAVTFTDIMTALNNGNVGIGTTTPSYRLHVAGNNTTAGGFPVIKIQNTQAGGHSYWLYSGALNNPGDFGLFDENDNVYRLYVKGGTGNVGIGTYAPRGALDVAGGESFAAIGVSGSLGSGAILSGSSGSTFLSNNIYLNTAANQFKVVDSTKVSAGLQLAGRDVYFRSFSAAATPLHSELLFINGANGNVGIGTITPAHKLDIAGSLNAAGGLCIAGDCKTSWSQVGGGGTTSQWTTSGSNIYFNTGNVAVGTSAGTYRLEVQATSNLIARFGSSAAMHNQVLFDAPAGYNSNLTLQHAGTPQWYLGNRAANNRFSFIESTGSIEVFSILQNGSVGIGTITPASKLEVNGTVYSAAAPTNTVFSGVAGATNANFIGSAGYWALRTATNNSYNLDVYNAGAPLTALTVVQSGNVGVGTTNPQATLHVKGTHGTMQIEPTSTSNYAYLNLGDGSSYGWQIGKDVNAGSIGGAGFYIYEVTTGQQATRLAINKGGNVGIGTTAPSSKLHVVGDITVSGNINAKYQDMAEWVPSRQKLTAGTVVVLDPEKANQVMASSIAYDTRVAGVVSAQPGVLLGEAGENKEMIATTGRVRIKVDATRAPIRIGDLLVTSDREGYAMKSEPMSVGGRQIHAPGTLLGKALESLEKGTGEILVLLSLQ